MPSLTHSEERRRRERWRAPGRLEARLAEMLAALEERAEAANTAYFEHLQAMLPPEDWRQLAEDWMAGREAPPHIWAKVLADERAHALGCEASNLDWMLVNAERGTVVSEHYWYKELGRVRPPKDWQV